MDIKTNTLELETWITSSGLAITDESSVNFGGVQSYYDEKNKKYSFLYPEIAGYFISTMCFLNNYHQNQNYTKLAKKSADWLINLHTKYGGIIQSLSADSQSNLVYSFDTGICAKGILDCYELTQDTRYFEFGKTLVDFLSLEMINDDGTIKPIKNIETQLYPSDKKLWYNQNGCLHIKNAIPFLQMYKITNEKTYLDKAKLISDTYIEFQNTDGSISIHKGNNTIHMHTMCYALEGLLYSFNVTRDKKYLDCCYDALNWCIKMINDDGSINLWFNSKYSQSKTCYHISQLIRLLLLVGKIKQNDQYHNHVEKLMSFLLDLQAHSTDKRINGGFYEESYKSMFGWKKRLHLNSWGSLFAIQALAWYQTKIDPDKDIGMLY